MRKFPGQSGFTKKIATSLGDFNKEKFKKMIDFDLATTLVQINQKNTIDMEVASFSSSSDFPEQLLSMLSFLRYVGVPIRWTIYSDGSHSEEQKKQISDNFDFATITSINWNAITNLEDLCCEELKPYHKYILDYANNHAFGKRLFYYLNHAINHPTLFIDSDILFYQKATVFELIINEIPRLNGWFMPDINWGCLDSRYKATHKEQSYQINAGFMFVLNKFENFKNSLDFYKMLDFKYEYFSEQTIIHILLKDNNYMPLSPKTFILDTGDQFDFSYLYTPKEIALRHYTGPVRHKMWQKDYKWHLSL